MKKLLLGVVVALSMISSQVDAQTVFPNGPVRASSVTATTGNFIASTPGKGLDLSANKSANAGASSNLLSIYEEGVWVPTDGSGAGLTFTTSADSNRYVAIGRLVIANYHIVYPVTVNTNASRITGLPFPIPATTQNNQGGYTSYSSLSSLAVATLGIGGSSSFQFRYTTSGSPSATNANLSGVTLEGTFIYFR